MVKMAATKNPHLRWAHASDLIAKCYEMDPTILDRNRIKMSAQAIQVVKWASEGFHPTTKPDWYREKTK